MSSSWVGPFIHYCDYTWLGQFGVVLYEEFESSMGSPVTAFVWRDVVGKRWISCALWQAAISSILWLVWEFVLKLSSRRPGAIKAHFFLSVVSASTRFLLFQTSQICFMLGQTLILEREEADAASIGDLANHVRKRVWRAVGSPEESIASDISESRKKVRTKVDYFSFAILCALSGVLVFVALLSCLLSSVGPSLFDIGLRGGTLGFVYASILSYQRNFNLSLPIIQRRLYFSFKMGIPRAFTTSSKLALALLPLGEIVSQIFASERGVSSVSSLMNYTHVVRWQPQLAAGTFVSSFCWEVGHHLIQVFQTKRHEFAPPMDSPSAEKHPTDLLLMVLEDRETSSLVQYHALLDLCNVSETNVDTWRRAAIFEETGDTYRRLINVCLKRLDDFTAILVQGLEVCEADKCMNPLTRQMDAPDYAENRPFNFQICVLCARTVASLTTRSRWEDKYGVAQLHRCNIDVVSSLLSCLLVLEVYLGRSSTNGGTFVPNSVKWSVPCRDAVVGTEKGKFHPFSKRTIIHTKAYALGDVVRTSLYQIVYAFSEEMVLVGSGTKDHLLAMRDWVSQKKPFFGTNDMHVQKLTAFLPDQID